MNKLVAPRPDALWTASDANQAPNDVAWLTTELAIGTTELDAGNLTQLADIRKEFGLE